MAFNLRATHSIHAEINMIPLIDVMLVLLIVFMVTAPLMSYSVHVNLPKTVAPAVTTPPTAIRLGIDRESKLTWNGEPITEADLQKKLEAAGHLSPQPELHFFADRQTPYEPISKAMAVASRAGMVHLGFESAPQ